MNNNDSSLMVFRRYTRIAIFIYALMLKLEDMYIHKKIMHSALLLSTTNR